MNNDVFEGIKHGLEQALAHARGEITLPHKTYETTWPDCPGGCVHMMDDLDCEFKAKCVVELCDTEDCRVGKPSRYTKG